MDAYIEIANLAYQTFQIPVYVYSSGRLELCCPEQDEICRPPAHVVKQIAGQKYLTYFTGYHACFCKLPCRKKPETFFLLGPVSSLPYTPEILNRMHREYIVPTDKRAVFDHFFCRIPAMTYIDFFHILKVVHYMIHAQDIPLDAFLEEIYAADSPARDSMRSEYAAQVYLQKESEIQNNSYEVEQLILTLVEKGDVEGIKRFISNVPQYHAGTVAQDALRMQKNYFISICTLITRAAIRAGLSTMDAYQLSDLYISRLETLTTIHDVNQLFTNALLDVTSLVRQHKDSLDSQVLADLEIPVRECILYVRQHTNQNLSVQSVADSLGYHRTYLSACFSRAMGFHLSDYIYRCKLEEAKTLLAYTDKSISEISSYLCFSSQSHFQLRFRQAFHVTPARYRKKNAAAIPS